MDEGPGNSGSKFVFTLKFTVRIYFDFNRIFWVLVNGPLNLLLLLLVVISIVTWFE